MTTVPANRADNRAFWKNENENNPLLNMMEVMIEVCEGIAIGTITTSYIFVGPPGCGKTSGFKRVMLKNNVRYREVDCASAEAFAKTLHECAATKTIALVDDQNGMWRSPKGLQWLMKATLPQGSRKFTLTYADTRKNVPLDFTGLVIVILTNKPREKWGEDNGELGALDDRVSIIEMPATRQELFDYTCFLAINREFLKPLGHPLETVNRALEFFAAHADDHRTVSPRTLQDILIAMTSTPKNWEKLTRAKFDAKRKKDGMIEVPVIPQIVSAAQKPRSEKLPLLNLVTHFCSYGDRRVETADAQEKTRVCILELHAQEWRAADIIEHVEHYLFVKITEDDVAAIVAAYMSSDQDKAA